VFKFDVRGSTIGIMVAVPYCGEANADKYTIRPVVAKTEMMMDNVIRQINEIPANLPELLAEERERQAAQAKMPSSTKLAALAVQSPAPREWWDEPLPF
jgi:hypothetical protein